MFVPLINRIVAESNDNDQLTSLMTRVGRYQALLFCYVFGGFVLLGRFFIVKWAGGDFSDAYWLIVLMVAPLIIPLTQNTGIEIQRAKNRHKARSVAYLCMAAINLGLTAVLAGPFGYWAPAIGYVTYIFLGCGVFMNWYYQRYIGLDMFKFWKRILPVVFVTVLVVVVCLAGTSLVPVSSWLSFLLWGALYSFVMVVCFWKFLLDSRERKAVFARLPYLHRQ